MSALLGSWPYAPRDDEALLAELVELTEWHRRGCEPYARMWPEWSGAARLDQIPYVHVSAFKLLDLVTTADGIEHQRTLLSSATTSGVSSRVALDARSSHLQAASSEAILRDFVGDDLRPLVVLDDPRALRGRDGVSARVAAALSLRPLATDVHFVASRVGAAEATIDWDKVRAVLSTDDAILVYGFTWILWVAFGAGGMPEDVAEALRSTRVAFVHSGGWKRLEQQAVSEADFAATLSATAAVGSTITDFYGLVEQVGVIYPICEAGRRHVPRWAAVVVRDPWTLEPTDGPGIIQSMNPLAWGGPYHSVLTEDLGRVHSDACRCGRAGATFDLLGRVPRAEVRGCANV